MNIYYHEKYNTDQGLFNRLHPFDGQRFSKVFEAIKEKTGIRIRPPCKPVRQSVIDAFAGESLRSLLQ